MAGLKTLHEARVHGQHSPKAPTFRLQPQPNLHEIQQPKLLVAPSGMLFVQASEELMRAGMEYRM